MSIFQSCDESKLIRTLGKSGQPVYVNDVCHHGRDFCWLNGCGDEVMNVIKSRFAPWLGFVAILSMILYVYGMIFTFALTKEVNLF